MKKRATITTIFPFLLILSSFIVNAAESNVWQTFGTMGETLFKGFGSMNGYGFKVLLWLLLFAVFQFGVTKTNQFDKKTGGIIAFVLSFAAVLIIPARTVIQLFSFYSAIIVVALGLVVPAVVMFTIHKQYNTDDPGDKFLRAILYLLLSGCMFWFTDNVHSLLKPEAAVVAGATLNYSFLANIMSFVSLFAVILLILGVINGFTALTGLFGGGDMEGLGGVVGGTLAGAGSIAAAGAGGAVRKLQDFWKGADKWVRKGSHAGEHVTNFLKKIKDKFKRAEDSIEKGEPDKAINSLEDAAKDQEKKIEELELLNEALIKENEELIAESKVLVPKAKEAVPEFQLNLKEVDKIIQENKVFYHNLQDFIAKASKNPSLLTIPNVASYGQQNKLLEAHEEQLGGKINAARTQIGSAQGTGMAELIKESDRIMEWLGAEVKFLKEIQGKEKGEMASKINTITRSERRDYRIMQRLLNALQTMNYHQVFAKKWEEMITLNNWLVKSLSRNGDLEKAIKDNKLDTANEIIEEGRAKAEGLIVILKNLF